MRRYAGSGAELRLPACTVSCFTHCGLSLVLNTTIFSSVHIHMCEEQRTNLGWVVLSDSIYHWFRQGLQIAWDSSRSPKAVPRPDLLPSPPPRTMQTHPRARTTRITTMWSPQWLFFKKLGPRYQTQVLTLVAQVLDQMSLQTPQLLTSMHV